MPPSSCFTKASNFGQICLNLDAAEKYEASEAEERAEVDISDQLSDENIDLDVVVYRHSTADNCTSGVPWTAKTGEDGYLYISEAAPWQSGDGQGILDRLPDFRASSGFVQTPEKTYLQRFSSTLRARWSRRAMAPQRR